MGGASTVRLTRENGWGFGPVVRIERRSPTAVGLDAAVRLFLHSSGFYDASGLVADLGIAVPLRGAPLEAAVIAGGGFIAGGDSDGSVLVSGGPYAGLRLSGRLAAGLGWSLAGAGRLWLRSGGPPPLAAAHLDLGLAWRW